MSNCSFNLKCISKTDILTDYFILLVTFKPDYNTLASEHPNLLLQSINLGLLLGLKFLLISLLFQRNELLLHTQHVKLQTIDIY